MMTSVNAEQLLTIQRLLDHILEFLFPYLPLANTHATDFITHDQWDSFLPSHIQEELLRLSDKELADLPHWFDLVQDCTDKVIDHQNKSNGSKDSSAIFIDIDDQSEKPQSQQCVEVKQHNASMQATWHHESIQSFVQDARSVSLETMDCVMSLETFAKKYRKEESNTAFIADFMSRKKCHEVNVMSDVCMRLIDNRQLDCVVDIGSGKGYLSTELAFRNRVPVLGIDSVQSNTAGAKSRAHLLGKQWEGLVRNAHSKTGRKMEESKPAQQTIHNENNRPQNSTDCEYVTSDSNRIFNLDYGFNTCVHDVTVSGMCTQGDNQPVHAIEEVLSGENNSIVCDQSNMEHLKLKNSDETSFVVTKSKSYGKIDRTCTQHQRNYAQVTTYVTRNTDLVCLVNQNLPDHQMKDNPELLLTGLHTCGDLGAAMCRLFVGIPSVNALASVGCCYNLIQEKYPRIAGSNGELGDASLGDHGFPMSRHLNKIEVTIGSNARNLASQSICRMTSTQGQLQGQTFFKRALLQVILKDMFGSGQDLKGLRNVEKKSSSFSDYVQRAFKKLNLPVEKITSDVIIYFENRFHDDERRLAAFFQLKVALAPCIEALIILDRVCYLLEQDTVGSVELVRLFDPLISPRCYGIIAMKS